MEHDDRQTGEEEEKSERNRGVHRPGRARVDFCPDSPQSRGTGDKDEPGEQERCERARDEPEKFGVSAATAMAIAVISACQKMIPAAA